MLTKKDLQSISQLTRSIVKEEIDTALKPVNKKIDKLQKTSESGFKILDRDFVH